MRHRLGLLGRLERLGCQVGIILDLLRLASGLSDGLELLWRHGHIGLAEDGRIFHCCLVLRKRRTLLRHHLICKAGLIDGLGDWLVSGQVFERIFGLTRVFWVELCGHK